MRRTPPGIQGYAEEVDALVERYEALDPRDVHRHLVPLLPDAPADVIDVGAGTGRDAGWLAAMGHRVLAVEPTTALRTAAAILHPSLAIRWLDDHLPELAQVGDTFDLVMLSAVWMHLDHAERERAMERVARLVRPEGLVSVLVRHGPVPAGRRMFEVPAAETIAQATRHDLGVVLHDETTSSRVEGVRWTRLILRAPRRRIQIS